VDAFSKIHVIIYTLVFHEDVISVKMVTYRYYKVLILASFLKIETWFKIFFLPHPFTFFFMVEKKHLHPYSKYVALMD
jgi:hypothetical protein